MAVATSFAVKTQQCYFFSHSGGRILSAPQNPQAQFTRKSKVKFSSSFLYSGSPWDALVAYQLQSNNRHRNNGSFPRPSSTRVEARLFGRAVFKASKLKVLFLGTQEENHPGHFLRIYTLTHSDVTAQLTLAISQTINKDQVQGWYNKLQRDEVIAEWRKCQGKMSLHVHCHISGGHWLLDAIARLRFYIFRKELPVVLEAFRYGDRALFEKHPELESALVWVYFHSNVKQFKRVECWGSLGEEACKEARLFEPAVFQASKLEVLFLGAQEENHPGHFPRIYTLTHSDITAKLTLAISQTINKDQLQGWYNRLQRDEVLAQWKKCQQKMSLHVHCHISGGHWLLDAIARLRFYIFRKELPVVLEAFRHGDRALFEKHPELETALVWVYFHSNVKEFKRVECWGSLGEEACKGAPTHFNKDLDGEKLEMPSHCPEPCDCCFPPSSVLLRPEDAEELM